MPSWDDIKCRKISYGDNVDYTFTDMGLINGEYVSVLMVDGKEYISKVRPINDKSGFERLYYDEANFRKFGFDLYTN